MSAPEDRAPPSAAAVLATVFVIATCGLIYELVAATLASYVLGDSVTQFSTVIGTYLTAMGLGSWLSKHIDRRIAARFIEIEILVAILGGASSALLFFAFAKVAAFRVILYGLVMLIGTLVGLEIPLLMRVLRDRYELKDLVARVLSFDYLGALLASLAFPLLLVPKLGLIKGAFAVGLLNAAVALISTWVFATILSRAERVALRVQSGFAVLLLLLGVVFSAELTSMSEDDLYPDDIVFARTSPYQRIVLTRGHGSFQLYLSGNLQFSSADEHRYHEALVHPPMSAAKGLGAPPKRILILGGGDGLAAREVLRWPEVEAVTLVDLDPDITELSSTHPLLVHQNRGALADRRVEIVNADAMIWLAEPARAGQRYDVVIIDFPDPNNFSLGKLYTTRFYRLVERVLAEDGALAVQATSPLLARRSYWCVVETLEAVGFFARGYHATVPAFGEWGYVLAARREFPVPDRLELEDLAFLTPEVMAAMFVFPKDMARVDTEVNRLNNQVLVGYYEAEWSRWF